MMPHDGVDRRVLELMSGYWDEDSEYPVADWQYDVANGDTRASYLAWVNNQKNVEGGEDE